MKHSLLIFIVFFIFSSSIKAQSFDIFEGDTINSVDEKHNKQGYWVVLKNKKKLTDGNYLKGKKEGIWTSYYITGNIKSEITYIQGEKKGQAKIYYENGNIAEEGTWITDKWVGKYKSYYKNGKLSYSWNYNDYGSRCGYQQYFYENGNVKIEGEWEEGKEHGIIKEYYETGALRTEKNFSKGKCDSNTIKVYSEDENYNNILVDIEEESLKYIGIDKTDTILIEKNDTIKVFSGTGMHIFYNKEKQPEKEGEFIKGILTNGKHFIYDDSGKLLKTEIYKNAKIDSFIIEK